MSEFYGTFNPYPAPRPCIECGKKLASLNPSTLCYACQAKPLATPDRVNKVGLKGVSRHHNRFVACIRIGGVRRSKMFATPLEAHEWYLEEAAKR